MNTTIAEPPDIDEPCVKCEDGCKLEGEFKECFCKCHWDDADFKSDEDNEAYMWAAGK